MRTDSREVLTKEELVEWFLNPVTKKVRFKIEQKIQSQHKKLGHGWTFDRDSMEKTAMETAEMCGKIEGLEFIFNLEGD